MRLCWLGGFLWTVCAVLALGQDFRAVVTGHVIDASSAAIPNITVQALNLATNERVTGVTDNSGSYTLPFLRPGIYRVSVEAPGFKRFVRDVVLNVGQVAGIDILLEIGALTESVTVTAETSVLESQNANRGLVVDQKRVSELPLNARNPFMLSILSAGVNFNGNAIYQRPFDNGAIADWTINGGLDRKNEFLLDGAPNNAQAGGNNVAYVPPVDSVEEFKIQTNSYDAQYGKTSGGIVNVSLKSGTNQLHGTGYEFVRRNPLDANSFQNNARDISKIGHFLDQYGGAIGGPIYITNVYNGRDRSFFFFNYEGYREGTPTPLNLSVPAPEFMSGDFTNLVDAKGQKITIFDPATGKDTNGTLTRQPFAANVVPKSRLNPIAQKILSYYPKPNISTPGTAYSQNNFFLPGGQNLDKDDFYNLVVKIDHNFGDKHHIFFRHASNDRTEHRNTNGIVGPGEDGPLPLKRINDAYVLDWVGMLTSTIIANARISVSRYVEGSSEDGNLGFDLTKLGFPQSIAGQNPVKGWFGRYQFYQQGTSGTQQYQQLGGFRSFNYTNTIAAHPTVTKVAGPHSIKAGVDMRWIQYNDVNPGSPFLLKSGRNFTQQQFNKQDALSGNSIASFLLGTLTGGSIDYRIFSSYLYRYFAPYAQDDWKVSRKLTLNIGLRWDLNLSPRERYNRLNRGFDPVSINPVDGIIDREEFNTFPTVKGGLLFVGKGGTPSNADLTGVQPRFGFAYQVSQKMVLRGGFGRYMINPNNDYFRNSGFEQTTNAIVSLDGNRTPVNDILNNPFPLNVLLPPGSSLGLGTFVGYGFDFFDPTFKLPYSNQFSFGIQYALPMQSQLEVAYVGNRGYKLQTDRVYNDPPLSFRKTCNSFEGGDPKTCDTLVPNPFYKLPPFAGTGLGTDPTVSRNSLARPFPEFGSLTQRGRNDGKLWYNALQATYGVRARKGLNLTFAYTFSKSMEQGGFNGSNGNSANEAFNDPQRFILERSLTAYDRPHVINLSTVYDLPIGTGKPFLNTSNRFLNYILSGWQHTLIFQYSSGRPWDLPSGRYVREAKLAHINWDQESVQGVRACVALVNDDGSISLEPYSQILPGCDLTNYNFLSLPRYSPRETPLRDGRLRLDAKPQFDMSLAKTTKISERFKLQFRAEAFNVLNTFWMPTQNFNNNFNDANFGSIIKATVGQGSANFPRQIQLASRLLF